MQPTINKLMQPGIPNMPPPVNQNGTLMGSMPPNMRPPNPSHTLPGNSQNFGPPGQYPPGPPNMRPRGVAPTNYPGMPPPNMAFNQAPSSSPNTALVNGSLNPPTASGSMPSQLGGQGQTMNRSNSSPSSMAPPHSQPPMMPPRPSMPGPSFAQQPPSNLGNTYPPAIPFSRPPGPPMPSSVSNAMPGRPGDLPMPYNGTAQYSHPPQDTGLTPGSEPVSRKSSRAPSPVPTQSYDALEGQFTPSSQFSNATSPPQMAPPMNTPSPANVGTNVQGPSPYQSPGMNTGLPGGSPMNQGQPRPPFAQGQTQLPPPPPNQPGFPSQPGSGRYPPPLGMTPPTGYQPQPGAPPSSTAPPTYSPPQTQQPGFPPLPPSSQAGQHPPTYAPPPHMSPPAPQGPPPGAGYPPPPPPGGQPGAPPTSQPMPPPPSMPGAAAGMTSGTRPPTSRYPQMPPMPSNSPGQPTNSYAPQPGNYTPNAQPPAASGPSARGSNAPEQQPYPGMQPPQPQPHPGQGYPSHSNAGGYNDASLAQNFSGMQIRRDPTRPINLLQEKQLIPPDGLESPRPNLPNDYREANCSPDVFRCTLNAIPNTQSLLNKCRLPLGILIHPFKDLTQLPVIQSNVIVRCRSCRTYINPFVSFIDSRRWKCNLCYRNNELPDEFNYDPVSKSYGEPQRRPEIKSATIEFIAPSEYMLRPPQAAEYLYVLDVSFNAIGTGYLKVFCETLLDELERIPGDSRTRIGFLTFDTSLHFFNLQEGLSQPQMLVVSDIDDVFLPLPEGLMANLHESRELIVDLLQSLPAMFEHTTQTGSALGAALQAAFKLMSSTGGRVSVFQTILPTQGPGSLKNREDPNERAGKKIANLGPATDFYKKLALDCSAQQVAVDLFMLNAQYTDLASVAGISKYSGGCVHYFPGMHVQGNPCETERFENTLRRYITRKIGFEAVMRIRCSRGVSLHTFHGNFFVRSTDLLSLPNINPDAGFGMQMSIEDTIETNYFSFQAALLYTSSKGERRIRVHTLCVPVTSSINDVFVNADQQAICGLLSKMAVDRCLAQNMGDARDALVNAAVDMLSAYGNTLTNSQRIGQVPCPYTLRLVPVYVLALLKYLAFRIGSSTKLDDRVNALELCKNLPLKHLIQEVYPDLYPVHNLDDKRAISRGETIVCQPPLLHLSSANLDRHGAYVMDTHSQLLLWVGGAVSDHFCQDVFQVDNFHQVPDGVMELPELDNETSDRLRTFIGYLSDHKPSPPALLVIREDSAALRSRFLGRLVEDRGESTFSYYEFLQHLQKEVKQ